MSRGMGKVTRTTRAWAVLCESDNRLDGKRAYLDGVPDHPSRTKLFFTRQQARDYNNKHYGYIRDRPDLKKEPHGWKMPKVVQVLITVEVIDGEETQHQEGDQKTRPAAP